MGSSRCLSKSNVGQSGVSVEETCWGRARQTHTDRQADTGRQAGAPVGGDDPQRVIQQPQRVSARHIGPRPTVLSHHGQRLVVQGRVYRRRQYRLQYGEDEAVRRGRERAAVLGGLRYSSTREVGARLEESVFYMGLHLSPMDQETSGCCRCVCVLC